MVERDVVVNSLVKGRLESWSHSSSDVLLSNLNIGFLTISRLLIIVEFLALHGDVSTEVLITVHASGEEGVRLWGINECLGGSEEQGDNIGGLLVHFKINMIIIILELFR